MNPRFQKYMEHNRVEGKVIALSIQVKRVLVESIKRPKKDLQKTQEEKESRKKAQENDI